MRLAPSMFAHIANSLIMLSALIFLIVYFPKIKALDAYHTLVLILLFAIVVGVHGISHLGLEKEYGYNPLEFTPVRTPISQGECPCRAMMAKMKGM